ncbi:uncharacterized protein LOC115625883 [Scaptodrosophila lebanonensis]|uniref:Uncharacterized protein LOC115625883 n=1 Tax=Drosophila lebanonensis TaxID=7225 RepID=A0A6J2TJX5_DROLE|nr:uncharacterized protein LOC115625883 [Scaptodrosophila lebanonensis]XP_030376962.1 uncharacterized protein LOC115625883 [Scaptodrosophila lebanonensis]XP_030376963.1 uncharacterized protein LOC115625883 [Scaptodrosophila lebanonensis]
MNLKSHANDRGKSSGNKKEEETNTGKPEGKKVDAKAIANKSVDAAVVAVDKGNIRRECSKVDFATARVNNLYEETIEQASSSAEAVPSSLLIATINKSKNNATNSRSNCICRASNKLKKQQQQRRKSLYENHSGSNNYSHRKTDVQIFTNTEELNQVNLNSSSTSTPTVAPQLTATAAPTKLLSSESSQPAPAIATARAASTVTTTATSTEADPVTEIARQQQQQERQQKQQLIMSPATITPPSVTAPVPTMSAKLRKSHSTPALKFDGSNIVGEHSIYGYNKNTIKYAVDSATEASDSVVVQTHSPHNKRQQEPYDQYSCGSNSCSLAATPITTATAAETGTGTTTTATTPESLRFGCAHYKRRAMFVTPCCNKFYKCRFCHDENESHHFDRKTLTELICSECNTRQKVQEQCQKCGVRFGKYTCLICNLFDDSDKKQYHCHGCGICRIGGADNFFHCEVCNMCLPIQLKIDGHRCVENISRSHCPVCLGDIHTSRIPCHIPDCGHLLHKMCFDQLLASGHYTCPTCQTSLIDMTALWEYLDEQALRMPVPLKCENQRVHIFCNDCHKTGKTKFHFIGLKCVHCGAYNTTQDVKRRLSLVTDEPSSA